MTEFIGQGRIMDRIRTYAKLQPNENLILPQRRINRIESSSTFLIDRVKKIIAEEKTQFQSLTPAGKAIVVASALLPGRVAFNAAGSIALATHVGSAGFFLSNGLASRAKRLTKSP